MQPTYLPNTLSSAKTKQQFTSASEHIKPTQAALDLCSVRWNWRHWVAWYFAWAFSWIAAWLIPVVQYMWIRITADPLISIRVSWFYGKDTKQCMYSLHSLWIAENSRMASQAPEKIRCGVRTILVLHCSLEQTVELITNSLLTSNY